MALPNVKAIATNALASEAVQGQLAKVLGNGGIKKVNTGGSKGGLLEAVGKGLLGFGKGALGFLGGILKRVLPLDLLSLVNVIQQGFFIAWTFNFQASNEQLDQELNGALLGFAGILGGTLGNAAGYVTCGGLTTASLFAFNPAMGLFVLQEYGEEALEEFVGNATALAYISSQTAIRAAFYTLIKSNRAVFNLIVNGAGRALETFIPGNLSFDQYSRQRRGEGGYASFADFVEERIESLEDPFQRVFFEEFFEEFGDACWESLYVVAGGIEAYLSRKAAERREAAGPQRVVEIQPNREVPDERLIIAGPEDEAKTAIVHALANYQLVENRDVGQIVGDSAIDNLRADRHTLRIKIQMFPYPRPPFYRSDKRSPTRVTINIPDINRSRLDWDLIKQAVGGANGYNYGRFRCVAKLDNGRSMSVHAASEAEGEQLIQRLDTLTNASILALNITEEQRVGARARNPHLLKKTARIYPGWLYISNRQELLDQNQGRATLEGNYFDRRERIRLHTANKPSEFEDVVNRVLRKGSL